MSWPAYAGGRISARMTSLDNLLAVLSHPARRLALSMLRSGGEFCLCELMAAARVSQPSMSRHMSALKEAGLVLDRRDAQWVRYRRRPLADAAHEAVIEGVLAADPGCSVSTQEVAA